MNPLVYPEGELWQGNSWELAAHLPDESVNCIVTSPPYWGLRDYGTEPQIFGGQLDCEHEWGDELKGGGRAGSDWGSNSISANCNHQDGSFRSQFCSKCGAWRGSFGLEPTPDLFIEHLVGLFTLLRPKLRKDGTLFVNLGDSYAGNGAVSQEQTDADIRHATVGAALSKVQRRIGTVPNIKPKDLCLIPFRFALAMQAAGWWVRNVIIWAKPNPMPESVTDRCTTSHEYIFFFTRSAKYWADMDAVRIPSLYPDDDRGSRGNQKRIPTDKVAGIRNSGVYPMANLRSVWTFPTQPYPEAHFATYPEKLPETCILMGCPEKVCAVCGKPWERRVDAEGGSIGQSWHDHENDLERGQRKKIGDDSTYKRTDLGIFPTCDCNSTTDSGIVLDPFMGSGCTGAVAKRLRRRFIGIELSSEYIALADKRIRATQVPMF